MTVVRSCLRAEGRGQKSPRGSGGGRAWDGQGWVRGFSSPAGSQRPQECTSWGPTAAWQGRGGGGRPLDPLRSSSFFLILDLQTEDSPPPSTSCETRNMQISQV